MRITLAVVIAGALCGASAWAAAPVGAGKVYAGKEGESVAIIPLTGPESKDGKQVLLYVQGTSSEFDGKALLHTMSETNKGADYFTPYRGENFYTLVVRDSWGTKRYELWVPGRKDGLSVTFDEKRTQALKAEDIYSQHQKQKSDGTLGKLAAFNRKEREDGNQQSFADELKAMNEACGTKVTASIDWKSVSDDVIKKYSIASYCANPLSSLRGLCDSAAGKKAITAKVKKLTCQFGTELKLAIQEGTVSWTTAPDAANQEEFATKYFEKNL
ncbi:hypothetical protein [Hyalangium rubrum]|uniref:Lipoprotein n=1 Tax=Hyalangium rubrum TaxID=3103134 RepID=A0ABU5HDI9_9BACT|nr:hypothetical protein [Hyalangium sp. s54d21]MDY7231416.1 hypothetical protein [Hyalangium sp. s54d21]